MTLEEMLERIANVIAGYRYRFTNEDDLQRQLAHVLAFIHGDDPASVIPGASVSREARVSSRDRFDLFVVAHPYRIVIEVKIKGSPSDVERQCQRYAQISNIDAVILVTSKRALALQVRSPTLGGKPFRAITLRGAI